MITAVAIVPTTPLVLDGLPGQRHPGVAAMGVAARRVTADLAGVEVVIAIAGGTRPRVLSPPPTDLAGYGLHLAAHDLVGAPTAAVEVVRAALGVGVPGSGATPSPVTRAPEAVRQQVPGSGATPSPVTRAPEAVGQRVPGSGATPSPVTRAPEAVDPDLAVLARWAPRHVPCVGVVTPPDAAPEVVHDIAAAIADLAADRRVGLLVAGDLGAGHGPKPPRPGAATASAMVQDLVVAALDNGRPADLVRLDPVLAADSAARAVGALRVLGGVLQAARLGTVVRAADAPLGVGYVVAQGG